jgi:hypothetical protein
MPSGIILSSGSQGATQADIEKVLTTHGYEPDKPEEKPSEVTEEKAEVTEEVEQVEAEETEKPKLTRKQRAIDRATRELQEKNRKLEERLAALEGKKPEAEAPKIAAPKRDDYASDEEFQDAQFDYRYKLRRAKEETEAAQKALTDRLKENFENYQAQVAEFKEEHDDWDEVVNQDIKIHESVYLAVTEQENGAQVTYYLGKHPDYARKLAEMTPLSAVMEVGRLAERLKTGAAKPAEANGGAPTKPKPRLPEPVKPVSTSATSSTLTTREAAAKKDYRAFKAAYRAGN